MEEETNITLSRKVSMLTLSIEKRFDGSHIKSKKLLILLLTTALVEFIQFLTAFILKTFHTQASIYIIVILASFYLFYPVLGYIGEKFTRYKILLTGIVILNVSVWLVYSLFVINMNITDRNIKLGLDGFEIVFLVVGIVGSGLFDANIVQFGSDQIQFASSKDLATFARSFVLFYSLALLIAGIYQPIVETRTDQSAAINTILYITGAILSMLSLICVFLMVILRKSFIVDKPISNDPVRQIFGVMKFAWKYNQPLRRSAFTYNNDYSSRLDLAKTRYGGPYTSSQVEDVKSFWKILIITMLSNLFLLNYKLGLKREFEIIPVSRNETLSLGADIVLSSDVIFQGGVTVIGIIIVDLVVIPFFPRCIPSMRKRLWIGNIFAFLSTISIATLKLVTTNTEIKKICLMENTTQITDIYLPPYQLYVIPNILTGIGVMIVYITSFEFILAQAPYKMQGLLIGFWFLQFPISFIQDALGIILTVECSWQFYTAMVLIQLAGFIALTITLIRYTPRQCNEQSDINIRSNIEQVYERDIAERERQIHQESDNYLIISEYHNY